MSNAAIIENINFLNKQKTKHQSSAFSFEQTEVSREQIMEATIDFLYKNKELLRSYEVKKISFEAQKIGTKLNIQKVIITAADGTERHHKVVKGSIIYKQTALLVPSKRVGRVMSNFFSAFPLIQLDDLRKAWLDFIELKTTKSLFVLLGTIYTIIWGNFNILHWTLLVLTIFHTLLRWLANKYRGQDNYVTFSRNVQLFLWPYILLAVGNALNYVISFDGLPENTFIAAVTCWLIWGELKGFVENAKICNLPIPPVLERIISGSQKSKDMNPPF